MRLILDVGSGASLPDAATARRFVDEVAKRDGHKHEIVFKAQLFESAPPNKPLYHTVFADLYWYAESNGYKCTASVFDESSLSFLLEFDIPFVKLACRPDLYWLAGEVPRKVPVYASYDRREGYPDTSLLAVSWMACVREYPALPKEYGFKVFPTAVSDHTVGWDMFREWDAKIPKQAWEKHLKLPDTTGPDAGPWSVTPTELEEIIS